MRQKWPPMSVTYLHVFKLYSKLVITLPLKHTKINVSAAAQRSFTLFCRSWNVFPNSRVSQRLSILLFDYQCKWKQLKTQFNSFSELRSLLYWRLRNGANLHFTKMDIFAEVVACGDVMGQFRELSAPMKFPWLGHPNPKPTLLCVTLFQQHLNRKSV